MQIIYHLGDILSEKINISVAASRGLIKLAIKEEFGPYKPISTLGLRDYQTLITNSLKKRLQDLNIPKYEEIVELLIDELLKNQSLITMERI
jgi:hypothetical protein